MKGAIAMTVLVLVGVIGGVVRSEPAVKVTEVVMNPKQGDSEEGGIGAAIRAYLRTISPSVEDYRQESNQSLEDIERVIKDAEELIKVMKKLKDNIRIQNKLEDCVYCYKKMKLGSQYKFSPEEKHRMNYGGRCSVSYWLKCILDEEIIEEYEERMKELEKLYNSTVDLNMEIREEL